MSRSPDAIVPDRRYRCTTAIRPAMDDVCQLVREHVFPVRPARRPVVGAQDDAPADGVGVRVDGVRRAL
jgi:hypothetical protein